MLFCSCHGDFNDIGNGYVFSNGEIVKRIRGGGNGYFPFEPLIPNQVLSYNYDSRYIVAYQIPEKEWLEFKKSYVSKEVADSLQILYNNMVNIHHCYWIVCKKDGNIYGPLNKNKYMLMCDSLDCHLSLNL
jgi:hypothetical protein